MSGIKLPKISGQVRLFDTIWQVSGLPNTKPRHNPYSQSAGSVVVSDHLLRSQGELLWKMEKQV